MILHNRYSYLLFFLLTYLAFPLMSSTRCEIRDFQTTRLKSTAGAGVGAILFEESAFLNPAPLAYYNTSSLYFQKMDGTHSVQSSNGISTDQESQSIGVILTDTSSGIKGSFSYIDYQSGQDLRKQFGVSFATLIGEKSSLGASVLIKKDEYNVSSNPTEDNYEQVHLGVSHITSENVSFGLTLIDPFRVKPEDSKIILGLQYVYKGFLSFMLDVGSDYRNSLEENYVYKIGGQIQFLNDFYIRFGTSNDKSKNEQQNGIGLSWVSPKLSAELAQSNIKKTIFNPDIESDKIKEITFSLAYRF